MNEVGFFTVDKINSSAIMTNGEKFVPQPERKEKEMKIDLTAPIGELGSVEGWKNLPIHECGEQLVPLGAFSDHRNIATDAIYAGERKSSPYPWGALTGSVVTIFVREGVAKRLAEAANYLPPGNMLFVWDAYRTLSVQQALFDYFVRVLESRGADHEKAIVDAQQFVSIPSDDPTRPPPHNTGGAVDLTIIRFHMDAWKRMQQLDKVVGQTETEKNWREIYEAEMERQQLIRESAMPIPMGTVFDGVHPETATRFYEDLGEPSTLSAEQNECRENRRMLWNVMTAAGFSNYPDEWWHYDVGNQFDSARTSRPAIYGAATLSRENAEWESMRKGNHIGTVAIADGVRSSGKLPSHPILPFVEKVTTKTGNPRYTTHPPAAAI